MSLLSSQGCVGSKGVLPQPWGDWVCGMWILRPPESSPSPQMCHSLEDGAQTISPLTLIWEVPLGPGLQVYMYWVQWTGEGDGIETRHSANFSFSEPRTGTLYKVSVWAERNEVPGSRQNLSSSTDDKHQCLLFVLVRG